MSLIPPETTDLGYIFAADSICLSLSILKQSRLKIRASTLNDSTLKTVFSAKWLFKVIQGHLFRVDEKPLGNYILRHDNFLSYMNFQKI